MSICLILDGSNGVYKVNLGDCSSYGPRGYVASNAEIARKHMPLAREVSRLFMSFSLTVF